MQFEAFLASFFIKEHRSSLISCRGAITGNSWRLTLSSTISHLETVSFELLGFVT